MPPNPIKIFRDGNMWCALRGEDLQVGQAHFAETPLEALRGWLELYGSPDGEPVVAAAM